jgi:RND superfamily putative drug exporter
MQTNSQTFAARMGRWSAQNRKKAIFGWLAFVIASLAIGSAVGMQKPESDSRIGDSGRAQKIIDDGFPAKTQEDVLVQGRAARSARSPEVRAAVADVIATIRRDRHVSAIESPYTKGNENNIGQDHRSVLVSFELRGEDKQVEDDVVPVSAAIAAVGKRHAGVTVGQFGGASASVAITKSFEDDFKKAESLSLPLTLIILVLAFGALVAAGVPLLLGLSAVAATMGLVAIPSHIIPMDDTISSIILLIGMAVGVDYTLFYLRREREERRKGRSPEEAIDIAAATSGRAVLVSGFTVMAAMAGLFFAGDEGFAALGIASIMVVGVAMIGSVTVVPAMLSALGPRIDKGRVPFLHRLRREDGESRGWNALLSVVLRRPLVSAVAAVALLSVLAFPALSMHTANTGTNDLPRKLEVMKVYDKMQAAFPGGQIPAVVAIKAKDVTSPEVASSIADLKSRAIATGHMDEPITTDINADRTVATVSIPVQGDGADDASGVALADLRDGIVADTVGSQDGVETYVTGMTAENKDFNDLMKGRAPIMVGFVLTLAFLLLLVTFRSIVIPIKAIVLNLLSVGAAYGILTWVFQDGHGEKLLGFHSNGAVVAWLPMFLFVILFGLSMDYHVFILSRVREAYDRGMSTEKAVEHGIKATAGTVTSAAIVMVAVFGVFATLSSLDFKQMGVGLASAILIDATIVRAVLLPATMKLLGSRNWYLPKWLEWMPSIGGHEGGRVPLPEGAGA